MAISNIKSETEIDDEIDNMQPSPSTKEPEPSPSPNFSDLLRPSPSPQQSDTSSIFSGEQLPDPPSGSSSSSNNSIKRRRWPPSPKPHLLIEERSIQERDVVDSFNYCFRVSKGVRRYMLLLEVMWWYLFQACRIGLQSSGGLVSLCLWEFLGAFLDGVRFLLYANIYVGGTLKNVIAVDDLPTQAFYFNYKFSENNSFKIMVAVPVRIYAHHDGICMPLDIQEPGATPFAEVQRVFESLLVNKGEAKCGFFNTDGARVPVNNTVQAWLIDGLTPDFFLRPLHTAVQRSGALKESVETKGDLSYYYAHAPATKEPFAKPEAPKQLVNREPGQFKPNFKASPFGTDVEKYETIDKYAWEDSNKKFVKIVYFLDNAEKADVKTNFGERQFELLIEIDGRKLRLGCSKTHEKINPDESKHKVSSNRVTVYLRKFKDGDVWFDLFKRKAIGEDPNEDK